MIVVRALHESYMFCYMIVYILLFSCEKGEFIFTDSLGHTRSGKKIFTLEGIVLGGEMWS